MIFSKFNKSSGFGIIKTLKDGIAQVTGAQSAQSGELVISGMNLGLVLNLHKNYIGIVFFTEILLRVGSLIKLTGQLFQIQTSLICLNLVVNGLGEDFYIRKYKFFYYPIIYDLIFRLIELKAPGIISRQSIYESLNTGVKVIDSIIPIGLGQRELIIGDRQTGKSTIAIDCILPFSNNLLR